MIRTNLVVITADETYTPTADVRAIELLGRAAGGGGSSGVSHSTTTSRKCGAGGGGGGIAVTFRRLEVVSLTFPWTIKIGIGGAGGAANGAVGAWNPGLDGGDTTIIDAAGEYVLRALGGGGASDWQIPGAGGGSGFFRGGDGAVGGARGGNASGFPVRLVAGGGGGGSGSGYTAAGVGAGADDGTRYYGGASGLVRSSGPIGAAGFTPPYWEWCQSGCGGSGGSFNNGTAGGDGGFPAGGGGGGAGGNPATHGGRGADGCLSILEWIGDIA